MQIGIGLGSSKISEPFWTLDPVSDFSCNSLNLRNLRNLWIVSSAEFGSNRLLPFKRRLALHARSNAAQ
jgi:hypothetical protein